MAPRRGDPQPNSSAAMGMPAGPPGGGDAPVAGAAIGGGVGVTYPGIPTAGTDQDQYDALQKNIDDIDNAMPQLEQDYDNAVIEFDNIQTRIQDALSAGASEEVTAFTQARAGAQAKMQAAQRRIDAATRAKDRYLTQQDKVADRQQKAEEARLKAQGQPLTPEQRDEYDQRKADRQASIDANKAAADLTAKRLDWEQRKFDRENDPARLAADDAYKAAQTKASDAQAALTKAQTAAYPATAAAGVAASKATTAEAKARTDEINALIAAGMPEAQAKLVVAQTRAANTSADVSDLELQQKKLGDLGTYAGQLQKQVDAGVITQAQATAMLEAKADELTTGATQYQRQQQTSANRLAFARDAMQQGALQPLGRPSAAGAAYNEMGSQLGFSPTPVAPVQAIPQAIQSLGADVSKPYSANQLGIAPQAAQAGGQGAAGVPPAVAGLGNAQVDWTALTWAQAKALLRGNQGTPTPQAPPVASVPTVQGAGAGVPVVAGRR